MRKRNWHDVNDGVVADPPIKKPRITISHHVNQATGTISMSRWWENKLPPLCNMHKFLDDETSSNPIEQAFDQTIGTQTDDTITNFDETNQDDYNCKTGRLIWKKPRA